jgi:hypothetical protein
MGRSNVPIFLVECEATIYDNDLNLIIEAKDATQAKVIAQQRLRPEFVKEYHIRNLTENPDSYPKGVFHEYSPHAGDPELGE